MGWEACKSSCLNKANCYGVAYEHYQVCLHWYESPMDWSGSTCMGASIPQVAEKSIGCHGSDTTITLITPSLTLEVED